MRKAWVVALALLLAGCSVLLAGCSARVQMSASSNTASRIGSPVAGTSVTSGSTGVQVQSSSRGLAAGLVAISLLAGTVEYNREERPFPSPAALLPGNTPPAPPLDAGRRVSEQDCTKPVDLSLGNLRCK